MPGEAVHVPARHAESARLLKAGLLDVGHLGPVENSAGAVDGHELSANSETALVVRVGLKILVVLGDETAGVACATHGGVAARPRRVTLAVWLHPEML
ncbi:hypothetical protein IPH19_03530 [Candidatus Uhrbacteria bacterium]|nr:MAG: hypothetical protein IPH19_03530 [Candidatus Uhrbacteria bacterium]